MIYQLKRITQQKLPYINKGYRTIFASIFLLFLFHFSLFGQNTKGKVPLIDILSNLEKTTSYQFTYANSVIEKIEVVKPPVSLNFKEKILFLERKTNLKFEFLENNFIAIRVNNKTKTICGYIIDNEVGMPLESVGIIGSEEQVVTDSFGYFKMNASLSSQIDIRYLGFKPISLDVSSFDDGSCITLYLEPDIESLSEIVLSNVFTRGINKTVDGVTNINFSNFGILPGLIETDVLQTIQALPGVQSVNETISNINIRGGTNDQNLILWDGIKMYQSGHFFGLISAFNPQITNSALIFKNGTSVDYSDGVSGTIAMQTDRKINSALSTSIASNFINADVFTDIPTSENSSLQLAARKAISGIGNTPTYENYFNRIQQGTEIENVSNNNTAFDFYDTSMRWIYDISEKDQLRTNFIYANNELSFLESAILEDNLVSRESKLEQNTLAAGIYYNREWNSNLTTTIQITNSEYKLGANNVDIRQANRLVQVNKVEETSVKFNSWITFNNELSLLSGYQFTETAVNNLTDVDDPLFIRLVREVIREHGFYSQIKYNNDNINIKVGARYSFIPKFNKHIIEPRFSINQKITKEFNIELLGEFKHQNTMQIINFQNDFFGIEKRRWFLSNNTNRPITTSKQISLGFNYNKNGWLISIENYLKQVDDIVAQSQGFLNQYIFSDAIGAYKVYGIECSINKSINRFSTWLSYTYANNEYTFNDFKEINFPNNLDINHSLTFGSSYSLGNLKISSGVNWRTGAPLTIPSENNALTQGEINYEPANSRNLEDYLRIDASATYKFNLTKKVKAETGISIWNISNNQNVINSYYTIDDNERINRINNNALEVTPNFSFRVLF